MAKDSKNQVYDNVLKRVFESHADAIIPRLLAASDMDIEEGVELIETEADIEAAEELNVEVLVPSRRNDRVYRLLYKGKLHVVNFEIQVSSSKEKMALRALIYYSLLRYKYKPPILSVIIYPFKGSMAESPFEGTNGDGEAIKFSFRTLPLWKLDARKYFNERDICMYTLLPAMDGTTREMLIEAIDKIIQFYQGKNDEDGLREELLCFGVLLRRANKLPMADIEEVLEYMQVYDELIEGDAYLMALVDRKAQKVGEKLGEEKAQKIAQKRAEERAQRLAEILAEEKPEERTQKLAEMLAEEKAMASEEKAMPLTEEKADARDVAAFQTALKSFIEARFPMLARIVAHELVLPDKCDALNLLIVQIASASDEKAARQILGLPVFE